MEEHLLCYYLELYLDLSLSSLLIKRISTNWAESLEILEMVKNSLRNHSCLENHRKNFSRVLRILELSTKVFLLINSLSALRLSFLLRCFANSWSGNENKIISVVFQTRLAHFLKTSFCISLEVFDIKKVLPHSFWTQSLSRRIVLAR